MRQRRSRRQRAKALRSQLVLAAVATLLISGCAPADDARVSLDDLGHVHSVATDGKDFFLASHHGLYVLAGENWQLRGDEFDVMGLDIGEGVFYASGHPGPTQNFPDPLGILLSADQGKTWTPKVLTGEVDFHLLRVVGNTMVGVAANYGVVVASTDSGNTWTNLPIPSLTSLSLNPSKASEVLLIANGVAQLSTDTGQTFTPISAPADLVHAQWTTTNLYLSTNSVLYKGPSYSAEFAAISTTFENVASIAAHLDALIVFDDRGVHISRDGGESFELVP